MKKLVWLNPVVKSMYQVKNLQKLLADKGFEIVECKINHILNVKNSYKAQLKSKQFILDSRCPRAVNFISSNFKDKSAQISASNPILIESALELSANLKDDEHLFITTPCEDLAELGRGLNLARTTFLTWKEFRELNEINLPVIKINSSPIPVGFFENLGVKTISLKSKDEIENAFAYRFHELKSYQIVELLHCENGCHNGDGL